MKHRALQHALKAERRLGLAAVIHDQRRGFLEKTVDVLPQCLDIGTAGAQNLGGRRIVQQRQQQVLDGHEFVLLLPRGLESLVEGEFKLFAQHLLGPAYTCSSI